MKNTIFKILFVLQFHKILHKFVKQKNYGIVLCLHRVSNNVDILFPPLKTQVFDDLVKYLSKNFNVCNTEDFFNLEKKNNKIKVLISFDDGYKDFIQNALPIVKKYNVPVVHNIIIEAVEKDLIPWTQQVNDIINLMYFNGDYGVFKLFNYDITISKDLKQTIKSGMKIYQELLAVSCEERLRFIKELKKLSGFNYSQNQMMNWDDINTCLNNNVEIGSHSYTHDILSTINNKNQLENEIDNSKKVIEKKTNTRVNTIAFPNGDFNENVKNIAKKSGYKYLFSTQENYYDFRIKNETVPRISIYHNNFHETIFKLYNFHNFIKQ